MQTRRSVLIGTGAGAAALHADAALSARMAKTPWAVAGLRVDGLENPRGLHNPIPRFSWQLASDRVGAHQSAWRIGVASTRINAEQGRYDVWDSGRTQSPQSFDVRYGGPPLRSRQMLWWRVTAWDERGAAATAAPALWEMGLLQPDDWSAEWISTETPLQREDRAIGLPWRLAPSVQRGQRAGFRLRFSLPDAARVRILLASQSRMRAWLDGAPLAETPKNHWGSAGPWSVLRDMAAGTHVVAIDAEALREGGVAVALLIRAEGVTGDVQRFTGDALRTHAAPSGDWQDATFDDGDWQPTIAGKGGSVMAAQSATLLRKAFDVHGEIASARLYATALGMFEPEINGRRLDDTLLRPEFTDYRKHCQYSVEDVTAALVQGQNVLGMHVADGWYGSYISPAGRFSFGEPPLRTLCQLEIRYRDGRVQRVVSDRSWSVAPSPISQATLYDGEHFDARRTLPDWSSPSFAEDGRWQPVVSAPPAAAALVAAVTPPIRRKAVLSPIKIALLPNGDSLVDFGQNFAGWASIQTRGGRGQAIALRYAELLNDDGSVDQSNLRAAQATDRYVFAGTSAPERYEPRFTYHGFRYVQIEGLGRPLRSDEIAGIVIHSDLPETGDLRIGSFVPQKLWQNSRWSQRSNFVGIPTDCPQRDERLGWTGDAHVFWDAASFNMDTQAFTQRFLRDMRDAQGATGDYADIAPIANRAAVGGAGSSPGWADAGVALAWTVWQRFGDTGGIEQHWPSMERFLRSIRADNPGLVWSKGRGADYGDWLALDAVEPGDPTTPKDLLATALWKGLCDKMADMAAATGRSTAAREYRALGQDIARAFRAAFVGADGTIGNGSQTGYILPLKFDLLDPGQRDVARSRLVADIRRRGTLLSTGFLGTPFSLDVLADAGESALVYDLLLRTAFPSWGYMIARGATTTWERWNSDAGDRSMNSMNHYALGAVAGFMFRRIAGIAPGAPGFSVVEIDPVLDARLASASGQFDSRLGRIAVAWRRTDSRRLQMEVTLPVGARGRVHLPAARAGDIRINGAPPPVGLRTEPALGGLVLPLPSGRYRLAVPLA